MRPDTVAKGPALPIGTVGVGYEDVVDDVTVVLLDVDVEVFEDVETVVLEVVTLFSSAGKSFVGRVLT